MKIEVGMILYFIPPFFGSGCANIELKKRLMLVIDVDKSDNTLTLINISKISGKPNCFTYKFNVLIRNYNPPLPRASFAKINDTYIIENFNGLSNYLYKNGSKLDNMEVVNIINRHQRYKSNNKIELITITQNEFMTTN